MYTRIRSQSSFVASKEKFVIGVLELQSIRLSFVLSQELVSFSFFPVIQPRSLEIKCVNT